MNLRGNGEIIAGSGPDRCTGTSGGSSAKRTLELPRGEEEAGKAAGKRADNIFL